MRTEVESTRTNLTPPTLQDRCAAIRMLVLDVDGVLTDGSIIHGSEQQLELKPFHVRDGTGLKVWQHRDRHIALLSGRFSPAVAVRAAELGIELVVQGVRDKEPAFLQVLERAGVEPAAACCVGDDITEVPLLRRCGLGVAVADACPELRAVAHYITQRRGGQGAVREVVELVLRCQGLWID